MPRKAMTLTRRSHLHGASEATGGRTDGILQQVGELAVPVWDVAPVL